MRRLDKYFAMIKLRMAEAITYAMDVFSRGFFYAFIISIMLMLWSTIYGSGDREIIAGFTLQMMIWYLVVTELVTLSTVSIQHEIANEIKNGQIAYLLTKPYSYIGYQFTSFFGRSMVRLLLNICIALVIGLLMVGPLEGYNIIHTPFILLSVILGMVLDFAITLCLALTAFWVEENAPFRWIYQKLVFTLGGMLMPLDLFPEWLRDLSSYLPFSFITYGPAKMAVNFNWLLSIKTLTYQCIYIGVFMMIAIGIYKKGVRILHVNGG